MKKIQVSTVKQTADVEVIYVNAHLISKTIKALVALNEVDECITHESMSVDEVPVCDKDGAPVVEKETGIVKTKTIPIYGSIRIDGAQLKAIHEIVVPFIKELTDAFEED